MIEVRDLLKRHGGTAVLQELNFDVPERALTAFVGRDPHRVTMGILEPYMAETAFTRWTIHGSDVPPSWDEAMQRADATSTK